MVKRTRSSSAGTDPLNKCLKRGQVRHLTKISDLTKEEFLYILNLAVEVKKNPTAYFEALKNKTLLLLFEKPSLRTHVSFDVGMQQLGGHPIYYSAANSPLGKKESIEDFARVVSRYATVIMARVANRGQINALAEHATIPTINGLDDFAHPCQMLADMLTIFEKKGSFEGIKMAYVGDIHNNVTYDLMRSAAVLGFEMRVSGPKGEGFEVEDVVLEECEELCKKSGGQVSVVDTAEEAVKDCDVVYTDSWMSYGIPEAEKELRLKKFLPWQVTTELLKLCKEDVIFMNCLPAMRGLEQTADVIDGPTSVCFDQAENRMHGQKALLLWMCNNARITATSNE